MALFDRASLVQIPSGYKEGKLYNIKPFDQPFEFERGSAATRVNENGLIETFYDEATNLLLQSNQFDTTWSQFNIDTPINGFVGYDGSNEAWLINTTGDSMQMAQGTTDTGIKTFSVYAKAGNTNWLWLFANNASFSQAYFNLSGDGSIGNTNGTLAENIEKIGDNGWYRCSITFTGSATSLRIVVAQDNGSLLTGADKNLYIQDAQLESGYFATPYIETTTEAVTRPNRHNTPRIDYTNGKSLLLEPQRTNLIAYSEDFGGYTNSNSTDTPNDTTSPEGVSNGTSFKEQATTGQHKLVTTSTFDGSSTYTFSIFAKYNGRDLFIDTQNSNEWEGRAWFDLSLGTANSVLGSASIEDYGDGWYRCIVTADSSLSGSNNVELLTSDGSTNSTTGDTTKGVYIYGAQLEQGSYATSYIPTNGQTETRLKDVCIGGGDESTFNDSEGVLYAEIKFNESTYNHLSINDGTANNNVVIWSHSGNVVRTNVTSGGSYTLNFTTSVNSTDSFNKIAIKYKQNDFKVYINGVSVHTDTSGNTPTGLNQISFDNGSGGTTIFEGNVKALAYFPEALTDSELQELTTI